VAGASSCGGGRRQLPNKEQLQIKDGVVFQLGDWGRVTECCTGPWLWTDSLEHTEYWKNGNLEHYKSLEGMSTENSTKRVNKI
jgi:hypothetical protein